ncbi:hypothetical protein [Zavarzinella formosa]|uniref:hypothetical protein n=1 Tax=Zavarzinella formosa TaxID=360055 RepID=UPI0002F45B2C|nr:hypothetical protein [Zavarzinella formosa]
MNYLVLWTANAENDLADVWIHSANRDRLAELSNQLDEILSLNAETHGTLEFDTVYTIELEILAVEYEVIAEDRHVNVLAVWDTVKGRPDPKGN